MDGFDVIWVELISFILMFATALLVPAWIITHKKRWMLITPIAALVSHGLIFYTFIMLERLGLFARPFQDFFIQWSAILRLQTYFSLFAILLFTIPWRKIWMNSD